MLEITPNQMKLIIECDVGVDDAYGIMLASIAQNVDIVAINVVHGNSTLNNCAINTKLVVNKLFHSKQQPPVYIGAGHPFIDFQNSSEVDAYHGLDGLAGVRDLNFAKEIELIRQTWSQNDQIHASLKLIELVEKYPNEITIVALGPLTNLALAMKMSKEPAKFTKSIKNLVIMGGNQIADKSKQNIEFNFAKDPIAAKIVIEEFECPKSICTFEMTLRSFEGVDLQLIYDLISRCTIKSETCKFMQTIAFHRESDGKFKDYISCDFITMIAAIYGNGSLTFTGAEHCCLVDMDLKKGLLVKDTQSNPSKSKNKIKFIESLDKDLVIDCLVGCFEKLASIV
jgi:purine nucleosidase